MSASRNSLGELQVLLITLPTGRLARLQSCEAAGDDGGRKPGVIFREPVPEFDHSRLQPLICFIYDANKALTHLAIGRRGYSAGTGLSQVEFSYVEGLRHPLPLPGILDRLDARFSGLAAEPFKMGGLLPLKTSHAVLKELVSQHPAAQLIIDRALRAQANPLQALDAEKQFFFQQQQDALLMSLQLAGLDRKELLRFDFPLDQAPKSFLEGLSGVRLREDPMLINDLQKFPGFTALKPFIQNGILFSDGKISLSVLLVNRQPLEELIGTDLIYYNETFKSFVMVQYKAMEKDGTKHFFRVPNKDLDAETDKMQAFLEALATVPESPERTPMAFRLNAGPFFLKFCPREIQDPESVELIPGMYFPLGYWGMLKESPLLDGKRGGKSLRIDNAARYLTNTEFATFVSNGWVGTRVEQSTLLDQLIRRTLESGRAVTLAQVRTLPPAPSKHPE